MQALKCADLPGLPLLNALEGFTPAVTVTTDRDNSRTGNPRTIAMPQGRWGQALSPPHPS